MLFDPLERHGLLLRSSLVTNMALSQLHLQAEWPGGPTMTERPLSFQIVDLSARPTFMAGFDLAVRSNSRINSPPFALSHCLALSVCGHRL
jgi:hypothetical protein